MKLIFGSRPVREDSDAMEIIKASRTGDVWSGVAGTPDRTVVETVEEPSYHTDNGRQVCTMVQTKRARTITGTRRPFRLKVGSWNGNQIASAIFGAAGVTEGTWTWTITSTRQTFAAWRTA